MAVLAMKPKVILLDEPFAGLDWPTTRRLYHWLGELEQQTVLVTHDIEHLESYDRLIWLEKGKLVADGAPDVVLPAYRQAMDDLAFSDDPALGKDFMMPTAHPNKSNGE